MSRRSSTASSVGSTTRKTQKELEAEFDAEEDDDEAIPDDCLLLNIPLSPRPPGERAVSLPPPMRQARSMGNLRHMSHQIALRPPPTSRETAEHNRNREKEREKERDGKPYRPAGNGTPPVPVAQGDLKSPNAVHPLNGERKPPSPSSFPINYDKYGNKAGGRTKSWSDAVMHLDRDARYLQEKLEERADETLSYNSASATTPQIRRKSSSAASSKGGRSKSMAPLPPLRKGEPLIDPLPPSAEKSAVLSRTRPSWLPPKDPAEERRHLKEYAAMMARAQETERKRASAGEAVKKDREELVGNLGRIWEDHVLPNWEASIGFGRTRELWWRGVAPRSRGEVWQRAVGNELGLSEASYDAALKRARDVERRANRGSSTDEVVRLGESFRAIREEIPRTYPELRIFSEGGPLHDGLRDVLYAWAAYRSDVGYVRGLNVRIPFPEQNR
jgi:hypothetical protein